MFDLEKLARPAAWLLRKYGGRLEGAKLVKLMYLADRAAIGETCIPITGDGYCSLKSGPVRRRLCALAHGEGEAEAHREWDALFGREGRDIVALKGNIPCDWLSERETGILDAVDARFHEMSADEMSEWIRNPQNCPEWRKPRAI